MQLHHRRSLLGLISLTTLLFVANLVQAQEHQPQEYLARLRNPATVRGTIGGESHDSYVIRARKGQMMTVRLSWREERNELGINQAQLDRKSTRLNSSHGYISY